MEKNYLTIDQCLFCNCIGAIASGYNKISLYTANYAIFHYFRGLVDY